MSKALENQVGLVYENLLITQDNGPTKTENGNYVRIVFAKCILCNSNEEKQYNLNSLRQSVIKSCGCLRKETTRVLKTKHNKRYTREYEIWRSMLQRCTNPNKHSYEHYGGRGISVCEKWSTFNGFWEDMKEGYSDSLELDRIDVNGNYCKENCQWTTLENQAYNQRLRKNNTSGKSGVNFCLTSHKWKARINKDGKRISLGSYDTFEEAVSVRKQAELEIYGYNKE